MYLPLQRYAISSALGYDGVGASFGGEGDEPILVRGSIYMETVAASPTFYLEC